MAIDGITISNLRGTERGEVRSLSALNILVGPNNCGKSTVLEALVAAGIGAADPNRVVELLIRRGGPVQHSIESIFTDPARSLELTLQGADVLTRTLSLERCVRRDLGALDGARAQGLREPITQLRIQEAGGGAMTAAMLLHVDADKRLAELRAHQGSLPPDRVVAFVDVEAVRSHGALEDAYSRIESGGLRAAVVDALRVSFATLEDLRILKVGDEFILHTVSRGGGRPVPAYLAGDGFKRLLSVAAALAQARGGMVVLEEPECFQHPRYLQQLVAMLHAAVAAGTQVTLSTHSLELLDALLSPPPEADLRGGPTVHRLRRADNVLYSTPVSSVDARTLRNELFEDLRT